MTQAHPSRPADYASFGAWLKAARKWRDFTQERLAEGICTKANISSYERNETRPMPDIAEKLARRLRVSKPDVLEAAGRAPGKETFNTEASRRAAELISRVKSRARQEDALGMLQYFADKYDKRIEDRRIPEESDASEDEIVNADPVGLDEGNGNGNNDTGEGEKKTGT